MNEDLFVSVIVPNYNHVIFLDERIQSILNQSYKNFEIIILDDCSTDNSKEVIEKYRLDPHVSKIVYNEINSGSPFNQWHKGFKLAKGELIWIAESDDYCSPELLGKLVSEFENYPQASLAFSTSTYVGFDGKILLNPRRYPNRHFNGKYFIRNYMVQGNSIPNASSCVFRKSIACEIAKDYVNFKGAGDWLFWIYIAERGEVSMINEGLNYFRFHDSNTTLKRNADGTNFFEIKRIFDYLDRNRMVSFSQRYQTKWLVNTRINKTEFDSEEIKSKVESVWTITNSECIIGFIFRLLTMFRKGLDYISYMLCRRIL